jgi:hypothetical protein
MRGFWLCPFPVWTRPGRGARERVTQTSGYDPGTTHSGGLSAWINNRLETGALNENVSVW